ncbi:MAG: response regulator transcription factor [Myxococcaceae bacterium]
MQMQDQGPAPTEIRAAILEDELLVRESLADVLEHSGISVVARYSDPIDFLRRVASYHPMVALIDLGLKRAADGGGMDGLAVLKQLRSSLPEVQALVVSGNRDVRMVEECYRAGAAGYLDKATAGSDSVVTAVKALARGERLMPADLNPFTQPPALPSSRGPSLGILSDREREVLSYVAGGVDNLKIATLLSISERTVKAHVSSLYRKLGSENRTQLALLARELGIRPPEGI